MARGFLARAAAARVVRRCRCGARIAVASKTGRCLRCARHARGEHALEDAGRIERRLAELAAARVRARRLAGVCVLGPADVWINAAVDPGGTAYRWGA